MQEVKLQKQTTQFLACWRFLAYNFGTLLEHNYVHVLISCIDLQLLSCNEIIHKDSEEGEGGNRVGTGKVGITGVGVHVADIVIANQISKQCGKTMLCHPLSDYTRCSKKYYQVSASYEKWGTILFPPHLIPLHMTLHPPWKHGGPAPQLTTACWDQLPSAPALHNSYLRSPVVKAHAVTGPWVSL